MMLYFNYTSILKIWYSDRIQKSCQSTALLCFKREREKNHHNYFDSYMLTLNLG